jgi:NADH-quinone oxidoreductase subunit M
VALSEWLQLALIGLPVVCAVVVALVGAARAEAVRWISVGVSLVCLILAGLLAWQFLALQADGRHGLAAKGQVAFTPEFVPGSTPDKPHATTWDVVPLGQSAVQFYIGVDGLNIWLVVLTAVLMLPCVLVSWTHVSERVNEFFAWLMLLQSCMFGVFLSFDIILFYVFFELSLIPLFFLIGMWGGPDRRHAARKFFVYTLTGSLLTFLGLLAIVIACYSRANELTFSVPRLVEIVSQQLAQAQATQNTEAQGYWHGVQLLVFFLMVAGFAVKVPLVPLHTWLPLAHVEAPTAGCVVLAGVLLKFGTYGFLRLCIPLVPDVSLSVGLPVVTTLGVIGIVYGAFCAYSQEDVKRLIAYSSVSHLGTCMVGMFSLTMAGLAGSLLQMINHGLSSGALFLLVGVIYERYHTRKMHDYGGMAWRLPYFGFFLVFITMSSVGLPGLNGFVSEALCLMGIMEQEVEWARTSPWVTVVAVSGMIFGAWYFITMLRRLLFGTVKEPAHHGPPIGDLKAREWVMLTPIALLCVVLGVYPQPVLDSARPDLDRVARIAEQARKRADQKPTTQATAARVDVERQ